MIYSFRHPLTGEVHERAAGTKRFTHISFRDGKPGWHTEVSSALQRSGQVFLLEQGGRHGEFSAGRGGDAPRPSIRQQMTTENRG